MSNFEGFKHGMNLGGWLSQCDYTKEHCDSFIRESDIKVIKQWGLDHIRLPVDYNLFQNNDGTFIEAGFAYVQSAIDWCKNCGINLILDLHKTAGYSFDEGDNVGGFFENEKYQDMFYVLWEEFACRYSKYESMLCFELLNEVTNQEYSKTWNRIAEECICLIRKYSPTIRILVGSYWNNHVQAVRDLDKPHDKNIVYNFHCYEPLIFTHQGAGWIPSMDTSFRMPFESTYADYAKFTKANINQEGDDFGRYNPAEIPDISYFENLFADAIAVAKERNVMLYCGEYGVIDRADPAEAIKWFRLINRVFEKHNIGRAVWSYKKMDFGIAGNWLDSVRSELLTLL